MSAVRIACVAAPTSNAFIVEILEAVADQLRSLGAEASVHRGTVADVDDGSTAFVIIPHEYYWFNPRPSAEHLRRTISLDTEHPGTESFEVTARVAEVVGAAFAISTDSVQELARRGVRAELFTIGYSERWDLWGGGDMPRSNDLTYMAAADPERVHVLAKLAPDLAGVNANLMIPPYEHRTQPRADFLMGEAKWRFLADTQVILNLHRESKTTLEMIRTVEAMCNGCVLLTEPSTGLGGIEPGTHILVASRESIGREAHRVLADGDLIRTVRQNAYDYCREELSMRSSAERLLAAAERVILRAQSSGAAPAVDTPGWHEVRPPHVPELAHWVPQPYSLPPSDAVVPEPVRQAAENLLAHRRRHMAITEAQTHPTGDAEIDVLIVDDVANGSLASTIASLRSQPTAVNLHVASIGVPAPSEIEALGGHIGCNAETSIGAARNWLIERSSAPYLLVIEAGDTLFTGTLAVMLERLEASPQTDLVYTMATYGESTLVNLFLPEPSRLQKDAYLTRGYLVRRQSMERLGGFAQDPAIELFVDHEFWTRVVSDPDFIALHLHTIGVSLARIATSRLMPLNPALVRPILAARLGQRSVTTPAAQPALVTPAPAESRSLPKVTALMGAYNYGRYIVEAIESAMTQDYPPELLDLVIVDDGSTDDTAELVAACIERHPGRINFVRQSNAGATAATNRARREATGELIALLDADDVWLPNKTRKQVALMQRRPELGMVFSQMRVVDGAGATLQDGYGHREPMPANDFARVLWENVAVQSSLIIKAELFDEMPPEAPYADWWLALRASQFQHIDYLREDLVLYRWHGANITGGVTGDKALKEAQKGIDFQRWVLRNLALSELTQRLTPKDMAFVWTGLENQAQKGLLGLRSYFGRLSIVSDRDREDAARDLLEAQRALGAGEYRKGCALLLRARACDPYDAELRDLLRSTVTDADEWERLPDPMAGYHGFAVLTDAEFLLADDARLRAYAEVMGSVSEAALVIDASRMEPVRAERELGALVERCGLANDDLTMFGVVGELHRTQRLRVARSVHAVYADAGSTDRPHTDRDLPEFSAASLSQLGDLARRWPAT